MSAGGGATDVASPDEPPVPMPGAGTRVVVTPMRRRHLRGVLRIDRQVHPRPWTLGLYLAELSHPDTRPYAVARVGTTVVGFAGAMVIGDEGHITTVAVHDAWRRRGLASRLLALTTRRAIACGAEHLTLEVRAGNSGAQELYRRFGYAPAGIRPRYYAESNEDAVIMWAHDVRLADYQARLARLEGTVADAAVLEGFGDV